MRAASMLLALMIGALASGARAGAAPCRYENGAVVAAASLGDIAGDFILDFAAPVSQLHETRAQGDGTDAPTLTGPLRLAGVDAGPATFAVADLDARNGGFSTEISGVIGADILGRYVVDIRLAPCRVALWPGRAPRFRAARRLRLRQADGVPLVEARVSDGTGTRRGWFALETGGEGVRLSGWAAALSRPPPKDADPASLSRPPARLRALTLAGTTMENLPAGLDPAAPPGRLGDLGNAVWRDYAIRVDARRSWLALRRIEP